MPRTTSGYPTAQRQSGAALVVGLLLLLVLTVLAISGTNTSTLSLIVAGNAQYSQNAFQAAESGIERSIAGNEFNPDPTLEPERMEGGQERTSFVATTRSQLNGDPRPPLPGSSQAKFSTFHFEIESTATAERDAKATNVQGIGVIAKEQGSFTGTTALE